MVLTVIIWHASLGADDNHSEVASSAAVTPNTHGICLPPIIIKTTPEPHFRNAFFEIGPSKIAGWGAFASRELRHGQVILREAALFTADSTRLFKQYDQLRPEEKQVALSLHANSLAKPGTPRIQAIWATNWHVLLFLGPCVTGAVVLTGLTASPLAVGMLACSPWLPGLITPASRDKTSISNSMMSLDA